MLKHHRCPLFLSNVSRISQIASQFCCITFVHFLAFEQLSLTISPVLLLFPWEMICHSPHSHFRGPNPQDFERYFHLVRNFRLTASFFWCFKDVAPLCYILAYIVSKQKSTAIFIFVPFCTQFFSPLQIFFLSSTDFKQFDFYVMWFKCCGFLHVACAWDLVSFSINGFIVFKFGKFLAIISLVWTPGPSIWLPEIVPQLPDVLYNYFQSFFSLCFILHSFYFYVF